MPQHRPAAEVLTEGAIRVFVAAYFRLFRDGLAEILDRADGVSVVGSAAYGRDALARIRELKPDVVLLDPTIPDSAAAIRLLVDPFAGVKVVVLASPETEPELISWAEAGVSGFVGRDDSVDELVATMHGVAQGDLLCSPQAAGTLLRRVTLLAGEWHAADRGRQLTARELEVVRLIDEGLSNKQIATQLSIELSTVKRHVHHVLEKLGVSRRSEAVARLRQSGLLSGRTR